MKILINILFLLLGCSVALAQMSDYSYKVELQGISATWHTIDLPDNSFGNIQNNLNDVRIFGITTENDTIEVPFLLRKKSENISSQKVAFTVLNETKRGRDYFFTFQLPSEATINHINLDFDNKNFDWKVGLEGSQDNKKWFSIAENQRIVSLVNASTNYQFTEIHFPEAKYRYFRVRVPAKVKPLLKRSTLDLQTTIAAKYRAVALNKFQKQHNSDTKQTTIGLELEKPFAISYLKLTVDAPFDYYRKVNLQYVTDSIETEQGMHYNYASLFTGTLSSIDDSGFTFPSTTAQKLKLTIFNNDNEPLDISNVAVKGYSHELTARFTRDAAYFLVYGNKKASKPNYDIGQFVDKIPQVLSPLQLGTITAIEKEPTESVAPLFENKAWLWLLMGIICLVLGYFSLKMLRK